MTADRSTAAQVFEHFGGQHFAQLHTPLIKRIDIPDDPLGENLVFVESHQATKCARIEFVGDNAVGGTVAGEGLLCRQSRADAGVFLEDFRSGIAKGQCFAPRRNWSAFLMMITDQSANGRSDGTMIIFVPCAATGRSCGCC